MLTPSRRGGLMDQARITGVVASLAPVRRKAYPLGRSKTSRVVTTNHLDLLRPDIRRTVESVAAARGIHLTDIVVVSPTNAIMP